MARYNEDLIKSKISQPAVFQRLKATPLDRSTMFGSYDDAVEYAKGPYIAPGESTPTAHDSRGLATMSYIGQTIAVYEDDVVTLYQINSDRTLIPIAKDSTLIDSGEY